jgi:hypothetical protein
LLILLECCHKYGGLQRFARIGSLLDRLEDYGQLNDVKYSESVKLLGLKWVVAAFVTTNLGAAVIINDGTTSASNYFGTIIQSVDPTNFSYLDYSSSGAGTMLIDHVHDAERDDENGFPLNLNPLEVQSIFRYTPVGYTPAASGVIDTLSFRIDYRTTDPFSDVFFFVERQGSGALAGFTAINPGNRNGQWQTLEVLGLTDADFLGQGYFSSATPIRFGFGFVSSETLDPFSTEPTTYQMEVDNFQVTVNPVPEPSAALLLLGAGTLLLRRTRSTGR